MPVEKFILPLLSFLQKRTMEAARFEIIKKNVKQELSIMGYKVLLGIVFLSLILFSVFQLATVLQIYLSHLDNGQMLIVSVFGSITVASFVGIYFLFSAPKSEVPQVNIANLGEIINIDGLRRNFVDGFAEGFQRSKLKEINQEAQH